MARSLLAVVLSLVLMHCVQTGRPVLSGVLVIVISPASMMLLEIMFDHRSLAQVLDPVGNAWSYLFGDTIFVSFALAFSALAQRSLSPSERLFTSTYWTIGFLVVGLVVGNGFYALDGAHYRSVGAGALLLTQGKLWHDIVVTSVLVSVVLRTCVPLVYEARHSPWTWCAIASMAGWAALLVCDNTIHHLDPWRMHGPQ